MNLLKPIFTLLIVATLSTGSVFAQDTTRKAKVFATIEKEPIFPGGAPAFNKFIIKNLKYPDVAKVIGLSGKVYVSFVVDGDGSVTDVKPVKCLGAGCESEAARVISMSPRWVPGIQDGKKVRVMYTVPIDFNISSIDTKLSTPMRRLRNSDYVFVFYIKGKAYTIDEAEKMIGKSFDPTTIASVEDYDHPEYSIPDKKGVYLIVMKDS
jgi:protein TonB